MLLWSENLINEQRKCIRNLVERNFMESGLLVVRVGKRKGFSYGVLWYGRCSDFGCCYLAVKCDSAIDEKFYKPTTVWFNSLR